MATGDELLTTLMPAMQIALFERQPDGSFAAVAPPPSWFAQLAADTFPFLGHILDEANRFWDSRVPGSRDWGPCAEVDERGREFHYRVTALTAGARHYLVFQIDQGSDRLRTVLQQVREHALAAEQHPDVDPAHSLLRQRVRLTGEAMQELVSRLIDANPTAAQREVLNALSAHCQDLRRAADPR
jgi:hypothetical protein